MEMSKRERQQIKARGMRKRFPQPGVSFELEPFNQADSRLGHLQSLPQSRIYAGLHMCSYIYGRAAWAPFNNSVQVHSCLLMDVLLKHVHSCKAAKPPPVPLALTPGQSLVTLGLLLPSLSLCLGPYLDPLLPPPSPSEISTFTEPWHFSLLPILSHFCHNCCCRRQVHVVINALLNFISHLEPCRQCSLKDTVVISTIGMAINNEYYPSHVFPSLPAQQVFTARQMIINSILFLLIKSIFSMHSCHKVGKRLQLPWETAQNI